jgi:phosphatidylinositol alpha-1,6-mannosyltransferase
LTVARLHPDHAYKGIDTLIEVWPQVVASVPDATLVVVGEGPDRARLERLAQDRGVAEAVTFTGRLSDEVLAEAYETAALFAMPGRHATGPGAQGEGFGVVYIEAGATGLPVMAGAGGGADDAVEHDVSGLVVDPSDHGAVAGAIVRVLTDADLARRLGEGGRRLAETRFSYQAFRAGVQSLIDELPVRGLFR